MIVQGDCLEVMRDLPDGCVTAIVTDPPYGLEFMGKGWDKVLPPTEVWRECLRVLKPGGHALIFGGTRTYHRLACAVEDAGFEVRDCLMWLTGQGFPKSLNAEKAIHEKAEQTAERDVRFVRDAYLSAPFYACRECGQVLFACLQEQGSPPAGSSSVGTPLWSSEPGVEGWSHTQAPQGELRECAACSMSHGVLCDGAQGRLRGGAPARSGEEARALSDFFGGSSPQGPRSAEQRPGEPDAVFLERRAQAFRGFGTALKPAWEPILLARKPLAGTVEANCREHGTGALNIDGCRIGTEMRFNPPAGNKPGGNSLMMGVFGMPQDAEGRERVGRWPANLILDEEAGSQLDAQTPDKGQAAPLKETGRARPGHGRLGEMGPPVACEPHDAPGGASRFFYCAKASKRDRGEGNSHPTVKPVELMRWLVRLVKGPGENLILDPFGGSGTTGVACQLEDVPFLLIEREAAYVAIAEARLK